MSATAEEREQARNSSSMPLDIPGGTISKQVARMAVPVLVEQSLLYLVGLSDTVLTGRYLSSEHLAAVAVAGYLLWTVGSLMTVVSVGATALVARFRGSKRLADAETTCRQAIGLSLILGFVLLAIGWPAAPGLISLMNLVGPAHDFAVRFFRIILCVSPLLAVTAAGVACLRGAGDTKTGMWVMILVNLLNIGFSWSLVRGFGPFPKLGFEGIALGTAIAEGVGGLVVLGVLGRGRSGLSLTLSGMIPRREASWRILRISLPAFGESASNSGSQLLFLGLVNTLGATATAAHGVAIRCESIAFLTVLAFSVPASTLTGQYLGAGRPDLARRSAISAWAIGSVVLAALGCVLYFASGPMFELFLGEGHPEVAAAGMPVLRIVAFAMPALATINVLNGALRGAGDTRWPWLIVLIGYFAVRMPLTVWFIRPESQGGWELGLRGAWIAMFIDLNVRGVLVAARFLQGGWRRIRV